MSQEPNTGSPVAPATGDSALDAVMATVAELDQQPVADHVAVFETAQQALRSTLDGVSAPVESD